MYVHCQTPTQNTENLREFILVKQYGLKKVKIYAEN